MKRNVLLPAILLAAGSLMAADPKDDVASAIKKLADADSYSWKQTTENAGGGGGGGFGGGFGGGPVEGKAQKDGWVYTSSSFNDTAVERVMKGTNGASNRGEGWQTDAERIAARAGGGGGGGGGGRRGGFGGLAITTPAATADAVLKAAKDLKESGGAYSGDLTDEGAKAQALPNFGRGGRGGGGGGGGGGFTPPEVTGAKGSVRFWVKDGVLSKYELKVQGKMTFNDNEIDINRTTTVEIKDVGTTKINVPEDVKKKLM